MCVCSRESLISVPAPADAHSSTVRVIDAERKCVCVRERECVCGRERERLRAFSPPLLPLTLTLARSETMPQRDEREREEERLNRGSV